MNTNELAARLAEQERISEAEASAHLDELTSRIRQLVREGQSVALPGLGRFEPGRLMSFRFDRTPMVRTAGVRQAAGKRRG